MYRDKNWLTEQYLGLKLTTRKIAEISKCSQQTILNWMKKHNIPSRKKGKQPLNEIEHKIRKSWAMYKRICRQYDRKMEIAYDFFKKTVTQPCYYCGNEPINGIDRLDNSKGYVSDNCIPCCSICNWMKHKKNVIDFLYQVYKIQRYCSDKYGVVLEEGDAC